MEQGSSSVYHLDAFAPIADASHAQQTLCILTASMHDSCMSTVKVIQRYRANLLPALRSAMHVMCLMRDIAYSQMEAGFQHLSQDLRLLAGLYFLHCM